ncbi:procollagen C-endopeptidase enhancer a [Brienomyrus brachyistius]|uniref:procollagen C-endopeptidase enhancer a n=1 Tax=Brienomyrus brachyistius TaxID=42636 RepID=UPI0020B34711|nr:procollagen C-endopeptidase enhancer a [Brienomyrus brachyistius]
MDRRTFVCMLAAGLSLFLPRTAAQGESQPRQTGNNTRPVFHCGGNLVADSGFVGSEGFPNFYKPDKKCTWYITVPESNVVVLSFKIFDFEADPLCSYDYLDVYNGHSHTAQKLGRFCGTFRPGALMSTGNTMMLEMVSDSGSGGRGFLASFNGGKPHVDEHQFCGGKIQKAQGSLKTPNWPEKNYPPGITCSWHIIVETDMVIEVKFDKFDLEPDSYCRFDYVVFFNGGQNDNSRRIGKYCGDSVPKSIVTDGNQLLVQFVSDSSVTSDGFMASYSSIPRGSKTSTREGDTWPGSGAESIPPKPKPGPRVESVPLKPDTKPEQPPRPPIIVTTSTPTTTTTPAPGVPSLPETEKPFVKPKTPLFRPKPAKPIKPIQNRTVVRKPSAPINPLCAQPCKRAGTIQSNFCDSEFVVIGTVTAMTPSPRGNTTLTVSLIKAFKAGRLTIAQAGQTMSIKITSTCKNCPILRRGMSYLLMGQVNEEGRGILVPGGFNMPYKTVQHKILTNLLKRPC